MLQGSATRLYSDSKSARPIAKSSQAMKDTYSAGRTPIRAFYARLGKRLVDLVGVALILPFGLPLMAVLFVFASLDGGSPVFSHRRVGKDGRIFKCYKVRTMVLDAEHRLQKILNEDPAAAEEWAADFKLRNDPRITSIGRFLRKTSLDELPQLWNVIRGDMSLVGPRPVTEAEIPMYGHNADVYYSVRPGLTGIWQVSGRNSLSFAERVELDRNYATHLSLFADLKILLLTVPAVLHVTGY